MTELLDKLFTRHDLTQAEARQLANGFFDGTVNEEQMKNVLLTLNVKGETTEELAGFAESMRAHAMKIQPNVKAVDTCGTGGDGRYTFNISTAAAFVVAAVGVHVAKHGNKSVSSACGSADVLQALGANINPRVEKTLDLIERVGFGFLFAPFYHPAMKKVAPVRKALGVRTCFNLLGPLTNPAGVATQVIGAYDTEVQEKLAQVVQLLGTKKTLVVHCNGLDEASLGRTRMIEVTPAGVKETFINSKEFEIQGSVSELRVKNIEESVEKMKQALMGDGFKSDVVGLNAALALYAAGKVVTVKEGFKLALKAIESGAAFSKMEEYVRESHK